MGGGEVEEEGGIGRKKGNQSFGLRKEELTLSSEDIKQLMFLSLILH